MQEPDDRRKVDTRARSATGRRGGIRVVRGAAGLARAGALFFLRFRSEGKLKMKQKKATSVTRPTGPAGFNEEIIGDAAGIVWRYLSEHGGGNGAAREVSLNSLKRLPGLKPDEAIAAVGWLAREGKLHFVNEKRKTSVSLTLVTS